MDRGTSFIFSRQNEGEKKRKNSFDRRTLRLVTMNNPYVRAYYIHQRSLDIARSLFLRVASRLRVSIVIITACSSRTYVRTYVNVRKFTLGHLHATYNTRTVKREEEESAGEGGET